MYAILISIYNGSPLCHFKEAINSILSQTLKPSSIHIVRDGLVSVETQNYLNSLRSKNLFVHEYIQNKGLGGALNFGLQFIRENYILRMDADDISHPNRAKQLYYLISTNDFSVVGSNIVEFTDQINNIKSVISYPKLTLPFTLFNYHRDPVGHASVIFNKNDIIECGGYASCLFFEDTYLWLRMNKRGYSFYSVNQNLYFARIGNDFYERRRGLNYAIREIINFLFFWSEGLISNKSLVFNILSRPFVRLLPVFLLRYFYILFLRDRK